MKTNIKNITHLIRLGSVSKETRGLAGYTTEAIFFRSMGKWAEFQREVQHDRPIPSPQ